MVVTSHTIAPDLSEMLLKQAFECFCDAVPLQRANSMASFASKLFRAPTNSNYQSMHNAAPISQKRRLLFNLWCTLTGYLSQTQLEFITEILMLRMEEAEDSYAKARLIRGMRSIKLNLSNIPSISKFSVNHSFHPFSSLKIISNFEPLFSSLFITGATN